MGEDRWELVMEARGAVLRARHGQPERVAPQQVLDALGVGPVDPERFCTLAFRYRDQAAAEAFAASNAQREHAVHGPVQLEDGRWYSAVSVLVGGHALRPATTQTTEEYLDRRAQ